MNREQKEELENLRVLQADNSRWFSQEEFDRLKYLKTMQHNDNKEVEKHDSI